MSILSSGPLSRNLSKYAGSCDIALLMSYSGDGGVERGVNLLIEEFLAAGLRVDVLVLRRKGGHYSGLSINARKLELSSIHALWAVAEITEYLEHVKPRVLLAAKDRAGRAAIRAKLRSSDNVRTFISIQNTLSQSLIDSNWIKRELRYGPIRKLYPHADGIIASSKGVADDVISISRIDQEKVHVVGNPVVTRHMTEQARTLPAHEWFYDHGPPIVISVGRLTRQKDFPTLLRAFAIVREKISARLIILGEGEERGRLSRLIHDLNLQEHVDMPGFEKNPYAYMANSALFVLSSAWEGFGNVLVEAMFLGLPVVSTDCRSGPREIMEDGKHGSLVPVGDVQQLASAMIKAIVDPPSYERLRERATAYTQERVAKKYMEIMGLSVEQIPIRDE